MQKYTYTRDDYEKQSRIVPQHVLDDLYKTSLNFNEYDIGTLLYITANLEFLNSKGYIKRKLLEMNSPGPR